MEQDRFTDDQWTSLARAPLAVATIVVAADPPKVFGMIKEMRGADKALKAARKSDEWPPVVRELMDYLDKHAKTATPPIAEDDVDPGRTARRSLAESAAAARDLSPAELDAYIRWVVGVARAAAEADKESGSRDRVSDAEAAALIEIEQTLRSAGSSS